MHMIKTIVMEIREHIIIDEMMGREFPHQTSYYTPSDLHFLIEGIRWVLK